MDFERIKIEITPSQTLYQVATELVRLGFLFNNTILDRKAKYVVTGRGYKCLLWETTNSKYLFENFQARLTTLDELRCLKLT